LDRSARHDHVPAAVGVFDVHALRGASESQAIVNATLAEVVAPDVGAAWTESVSVSAFTFAWFAGLSQAATAGPADGPGATVGLEDACAAGVPTIVGAADGPGPPVGLEDVAGSVGTDDPLGLLVGVSLAHEARTRKDRVRAEIARRPMAFMSHYGRDLERSCVGIDRLIGLLSAVRHTAMASA
jgi:hypothetical protein